MTINDHEWLLNDARSANDFFANKNGNHHCWSFPFHCLPSKFHTVPGYCYSDRLSFPGFRLSVTSRKCLPWSFLRMCYHPDSGLSVVLLPELLPSEVLADGAPFWPSYGLHCCFPPMVKRFRLSPSHVSGKFSVAEASLLSLRCQVQPSSEHFSVTGVRRFPAVLPSGFRLRLFR